MLEYSALLFENKQFKIIIFDTSIETNFPSGCLRGPSIYTDNHSGSLYSVDKQAIRVNNNWVADIYFATCTIVYTLELNLIWLFYVVMKTIFKSN